MGTIVYEDYAVAPFTWTYTADDGTSFTDNNNPTLEPNFKFDPKDNIETLYPKFTKLVKSLKSFVKSNPDVLSALQYWSGFTKQQILDNLTNAEGPIIVVEEMIGRYGYYNQSKGIKVLHIKASFVRGLEQASLRTTQNGTAFLLAVTILHEFVHYGTNMNNKSEGIYDFGLGFEETAFNVIVDMFNANKLVIKYSELLP